MPPCVRFQSQVTETVAGKGLRELYQASSSAGGLAGDRLPGVRPPGTWSRAERSKRRRGPSECTAAASTAKSSLPFIQSWQPLPGPPCTGAGALFCSPVVGTVGAMTG